MRRTTVLLLALLVLVAAAAGTFYVRGMLMGRTPLGPAETAGRHARNPVVIPGGTSLKDALGIIRRRYLLKPDGRVLRALYEIDHFPGRVAAGGWRAGEVGRIGLADPGGWPEDGEPAASPRIRCFVLTAEKTGCSAGFRNADAR